MRPCASPYCLRQLLSKASRLLSLVSRALCRYSYSITSKSVCVASAVMPHDGHTRRTRRCASTASSESEKLNGSSPISSKRAMLSAAEFVCRVENTR